jgi:hypothetical protein
MSSAPDKLYANPTIDKDLKYVTCSTTRLEKSDLEYLSPSAVYKMLQEARDNALEEAAQFLSELHDLPDGNWSKGRMMLNDAKDVSRWRADLIRALKSHPNMDTQNGGGK